MNEVVTGLIMFFFFCYQSTGQEITGVVAGFEKYPLYNAVVKSQKSGLIVKTDSLGKFMIEVSDDETILISASGFVSRKIKVKDKSMIYVNLKYSFTENSYKDVLANKHMTTGALDEALRKYPGKGMRDYSRYQNIYELIRDEFRTLRVDGTNVYNRQAISFSMSSQVTYVVDDMVVLDISFVRPTEIRKIELLEGPEAAEWGVRGANGVLRIVMKGAQ